MSLELAKLQKRRADIAQEMKGIISLTESEDRGLTEEENKKWQEMRSGVEELDKRIELVKEALSLEESTTKRDAPFPKENRSYHMGENGVPTEFEERSHGEDSKRIEQQARYHRAFCSLLRSTEAGLSGLLPEEQRILRSAYKIEETRTNLGSTTSIGTNAGGGGYLVPEAMANQIIETMKSFGGIRQHATVISTTSGNPIPFPLNDDTANEAEIVEENAQVKESDLTFTQARLGAYKYSSKIVRVSMELMQDSAFSIDAFISRKFGQRLGRGTSKHYAIGTGTEQPTGIVTAATVGHTAETDAPAYIDLLKLKHSVDPAYRTKARWGFNDQFLLALKSMKDLNDRPLWQPAISAGAPDLIDGDPYFIDQGIAAPAADAISAVYGDFSEFVIRDVIGIAMMRLFERYAEYNQVGFVAFMRTDSNLMDVSAVKSLQLGSTAAPKKAKK